MSKNFQKVLTHSYSSYSLSYFGKLEGLTKRQHFGVFYYFAGCCLTPCEFRLGMFEVS